MDFIKYPHLERFGNLEVYGIELGECFVFPKLDGSNASVWYDTPDLVGCGSRNRKLSAEKDNQGFYNYVQNHDGLIDLTRDYPQYIFYGEWLVKHTIGHYHPTAYNEFYVFDVYDRETEQFLHYNQYKPIIEGYDVDYVPAIATVRNADASLLVELAKQNKFLIPSEETRPGEGVVIKRYDYQNSFGRTTWAKVVLNEFKDEFHKKMGGPALGPASTIEEQLANECVTQALVDKEFEKIVHEKMGWTSGLIPRLLETVFYCVVTEELYNKVYRKLPPVDFKKLKHLVYSRVKELKKDVF